MLASRKKQLPHLKWADADSPLYLFVVDCTEIYFQRANSALCFAVSHVDEMLLLLFLAQFTFLEVLILKSVSLTLCTYLSCTTTTL